MPSLHVTGRACSMGNARITCEFSEQAQATSIKLDGRELLANLDGAEGDPDRHHSFYCDYHVAGKTEHMAPSRLEVITNTPELVHVAYVDDTSPLNISYHLAILGDEPAIFGYVVAHTGEADVCLNELRCVYRFDASLLDHAVTSERCGLQPSARELARHEKLQDETFRFKGASLFSNSNVYSKYDYAGYFAEQELWGQYGNLANKSQLGAWFIPFDKSCYPGGPLKQDLLVHYDGIILNYLTGAHFGTGDFVVPHNWSKLYGPWCVYFNCAADAEADARQWKAAHSLSEIASKLIADSDIYCTHMASLEANLHPSNTAATGGSSWQIVLSDTKGDYFHAKAGRIYYADAQAGAPFVMRDIQPGIYWLHVWEKGGTNPHEYVFGPYELDADECLHLGNLVFDRPGAVPVWNIGTYTRTTHPHAYSDQLRNYIWMGLAPANLVYEIGAGDTWYYLQRAGGCWKVLFEKPHQDASSYWLYICLAGATAFHMTPGSSQVSYEVSLNGRQLRCMQFENDRAAYRSSVTGGDAHTICIELSAEDFEEHNTLELKTDGYIMYDMVALVPTEM